MIFSNFFFKNIFLVLVIVFVNNKILQAQLPDSIFFCSHSKATIFPPKKANIDYAKHDIYDVNFYYLDLETETEDTYLKGFVEMQATVDSELIDTIFLELTKVLVVDSIFVNHKKTIFEHNANDILLILPSAGLLAEEIFTTKIVKE